MQLDTLDRNDLFQEISDIARENGIASKEQWNELCDEVIESHIALGELDADQDHIGVRSILKDMWEEHVRESGPESAHAIGEDPRMPHE